jgi:hypothetical protein
MRLLTKSARNMIFSVVALSCTAALAEATEKYWIAHEAQLIVVGRFHEERTYPWIDGWHVTGTVAVDEVLYGSAVPRRINYRLVCRWAMCRTWPSPRIAKFFGEKGIWFLRSVNAQTWGPPGYEGIDPGFRTIDQRSAYEDYIRRYKH